MEGVKNILMAPEFSVGICVVSATEFWSRLRAENQESVFKEEWAEFRELFLLADVDETVALKAVEIRNAASGRLPTVDSLIAAAAAVNDAVLIHRDPHFGTIPSKLLKHEFLTS